MTENDAKRLIGYCNIKKLSPADRIFPIYYSMARSLVKRYGQKLSIEMSPPQSPEAIRQHVKKTVI